MVEELDLFKSWTKEMIESVIHSRRGGNRRLGRSPEELNKWNIRISESVKLAWSAKTTKEIEEFRATMSMVHFNKTPREQEEWNRKVGASNLETWHNRTPGEKDSFRQMVKAQWASRTFEEREEIANKVSKSVKSIWDHTPEVYGEDRNRLIGESSSKRWANKSPEDRYIFSLKASETQKRVWARLTPAERDNWIRHAVGGQKRKPSAPEIMLGVYLESNFPNTWIYNGDGKAGMVIGRRVPDFYNKLGHRAVIEVLGALGFYHYEEDEELKKIHYKNYGYVCTVVWEWDCYLPKELDKIFKKDTNVK